MTNFVRKKLRSRPSLLRLKSMNIHLARKRQSLTLVFRIRSKITKKSRRSRKSKSSSRSKSSSPGATSMPKRTRLLLPKKRRRKRTRLPKAKCVSLARNLLSRRARIWAIRWIIPSSAML